MLEFTKEKKKRKRKNEQLQPKESERYTFFMYATLEN